MMSQRFPMRLGRRSRPLLRLFGVRGVENAYVDVGTESLTARFGWAHVDVPLSNLAGWRTATFKDLPFFHHRPEGVRDGAAFSADAYACNTPSRRCTAAGPVLGSRCASRNAALAAASRMSASALPASVSAATALYRPNQYATVAFAIRISSDK